MTVSIFPCGNRNRQKRLGEDGGGGRGGGEGELGISNVSFYFSLNCPYHGIAIEWNNASRPCSTIRSQIAHFYYKSLSLQSVIISPVLKHIRK